MRTTRDQEFEEFVRRRRPHLVGVARHLTGGDTHLAEDLVQATLVRLYVTWPRARRTNLDAYARRALINAFIDHERRPQVRRERSFDELPDHAGPAGEGLDAALLEALRALPERQRAAVVLRHVHDLPVGAVADALSCSEGNVKSQTARGLEKLRAALTVTPSGELS